MRYLLLFISILLSSVSKADTFTLDRPPYEILHKTVIKILDETNGIIATGFLTQGKSGKFYIMTNFHVCLNRIKRYKEVNFVAPFKPDFKETIRRYQPYQDMCAIGIDHIPANYLRIAENIPKNDVKLYTFGYPLGKPHDSMGYIKGFFNILWSVETRSLDLCPPLFVSNNMTRTCDIPMLILKTTLYAEPGSSGSPVVNSQGELVGIINTGQMYDPTHESAGTIWYQVVKDFVDTL